MLQRQQNVECSGSSGALPAASRSLALAAPFLRKSLGATAPRQHGGTSDLGDTWPAEKQSAILKYQSSSRQAATQLQQCASMSLLGVPEPQRGQCEDDEIAAAGCGAVEPVSPQLLRRTQHRLRMLGRLLRSSSRDSASAAAAQAQPSADATMAHARLADSGRLRRLVPQFSLAVNDARAPATAHSACFSATSSLEDAIMPSPAGVDDSSTVASNRFHKLRRLRAKHLTVHSSSSDYSALWKFSVVDNSWRHSAAGHSLKLTGSSVERLASVERQCLQTLCFELLQKANLGCAIVKPKDSQSAKANRQKYIKRKSHTISIGENHKEGAFGAVGSQGPESKVFGIPLVQCIENDLRVRSEVLRNSSANASCNQTLDFDEMEYLMAQANNAGECGSHDETLSGSKSSLMLAADEAEAAEDLRLSSRSSCSQLDASFNTSSSSSSPPPVVSRQASLEPHVIQVPKIVQSCCDYLELHGLNTVGLFRIAGSAKRCRQMRLELDSGRAFFTGDAGSHSGDTLIPHDIATLLKEYFRDLPSPLLTKELYSAFLAAGKMQSEERKLEVVKCLIAVLPLSNVDTLILLLGFLKQVANHAFDTINDSGINISGNKMNTHNLATIFGPTILRPCPSKSVQQHLSDFETVISLTNFLISNCDIIFKVSPETQNQIYLHLQQTDPEAVDQILSRLHHNLLENKGCNVVPCSSLLYSTEEETLPATVSHDGGETVITTTQVTTHRILYRIRQASEHSPSQSDAAPLDSGECSDKFADLNLFIDDTSDSEGSLQLIDPEMVKRKSKGFRNNNTVAQQAR